MGHPQLRNLASALSLLVVAAADAQDRPAPVRPAIVPMANEPVRLDSVGLKLFVPEGILSQIDRAGQYETVQISPQPPATGWAVTVTTPRTTRAEIAPLEVADEALNQLLEAVGVKRVSPDPVTGIRVRPVDPAAQVIQEIKALSIPGCSEPGARFYVRIARSAGEPPAVRGYSVFRASPGQFVVFELFTTDGEFDKAKSLYEIIVAKAELAPIAEQIASRGVAVEAGVAVISGLTPDDLRSLVSGRREQLLRSYREAPGGADADAVEVGYQRIRARAGQRGELDTGRDRSRWDAEDKREGFIVTIEARTILHPERQLVDSLGTYFMAADRSEEAWTIQMAIRSSDPKKTEREPVNTWFETGAREGSNMTVTVSGKGQPGKAIRPMVPDQGYINQVEGLLLPQILLRAGKAGEFGFYTYQSRDERVNLRRDVLTEERAGVWKLTTKITEDAQPRAALYNDRAELIRASLPDRILIEPITPERLLQLWRSKGLPLN